MIHVVLRGSEGPPRATRHGPQKWARQYWTYILGSGSGNAMDIGVTNDLERRIWEHHAIAREKQLKGWRRERKNELVRTINPAFRDPVPSAQRV